MNEVPGPLHDQVAIVTGGGGGIGRATCLALARGGARVVVVDVDPERLAATVEAVERLGGGRGTLGLPLDVSREPDMEEMARRALDTFGRIDILVACAGILRGRGVKAPRPLVQVTCEEWDSVIGVNLKGTFLSDRAVLPAMIRQRRGQILNVSSTSGRQGRAFDAVYCASKFGVVGLSESLAEEVRHYGIRVQVVLPDAVDTPLWQQNGPIGPPPDALTPERVADLLTYMLSLPEDAVLQGPVIAPFRGRRRRGNRPGPEAGDQADVG
jgi:NAD(P)-dependent dehydrogenase (short-subunit alcohol dehydrogenase family)